jgi:hypothetical protein
MSYQAIVTGIHDAIEAAHPELACLPYEPTHIDPPMLYSLLDRVDYAGTGQIKSSRYRILHRLCFLWQDNEQAEAQLMPYVDSIPLAIRNDAHLGGAITSGLATISEVIGTFVNISGTLYRCLDFYSDITVKG